MQLPAKLPGCTVSKVGLQITSESFKDWETIGSSLIFFHSGFTWWIGDWYNYGEDKWRGRLLEFSDLVDIPYGTLLNATYLCRRIELKRRHPSLSVAHHMDVAHLSPEEQDKWLSLCEQHRLKRSRLRLCIRENKLLTEEQCERLLLNRGGGILSIAALAIKFDLLLSREPIQKLSEPELLQRHNELTPFVEADRRIMARIKELDHHGTR